MYGDTAVSFLRNLFKQIWASFEVISSQLIPQLYLFMTQATGNTEMSQKKKGKKTKIKMGF